MAELARLFPPPPGDPLAEAALQRLAEGDIGFRLWARELRRRQRSFALTRLRGGTKFPVSETLRAYFGGYLYRLLEHGPRSFPSSFNVIEGFLKFSYNFTAFDIREEREHLLRLYDYIEWYTAANFPDDPRTLVDVLPEGVIYCYNMVAPLEDFRVKTACSELILLGIAMVRHSTELSMMAVIGEAPPNPADEEVAAHLAGGRPVEGREAVHPDPSLSVASRYLTEAPGFARVLALARFDLDSRRYNVKYAMVDTGAQYLILTDDPSQMPRGIGAAKRRSWLQTALEGLERYDSLFGMLATAMYLPAFFISERARVVSTNFATDLEVQRSSPEVQEAVEILGEQGVPFLREIRCLSRDVPGTDESIQTIEPPEFAFTSSGFWRSLSPTEVGEDAAGNPIVGRTWVERTESWPVKSLDSFVVSRHPRSVVGPDPGMIYIMRAASHGTDVYKVGLTRRDAGTRV